MDTEKTTPSADSTTSKTVKLAWRPLKLKEIEIATKTTGGSSENTQEDSLYYISS